MEIRAFEELMQRHMGLDPGSAGASAMQAALQERMRSLNLSSLDEYWLHINRSQGELQALVEQLVVLETWFLRDSAVFAAIKKIAMEEWLPQHREGTLKILSVPCATGEEPYSLAITLYDVFPLDRVKIEGVDISSRALEKARSAVYHDYSFRGTDAEFVRRYFNQVGNRKQVSESIRKLVSFDQANLLDEAYWLSKGPYDFILCRNVLIYFDRQTQEQVIGRLKRLLHPQGTMFVGPAEASLCLNHGFASVKIAQTFAFRIKTGSEPVIPAVPGKKTPLAAPRPVPPMATPVVAKALLAPMPTLPPKPPTPPVKVEPEGNPLEEARHLADQGEFQAATELCQSLLQQENSSPQLYFLLGLIHDAQGREEPAAQYYRKALYLDPNHVEAVQHLVLISERLGDQKTAMALRNRLVRMQPQSP